MTNGKASLDGDQAVRDTIEKHANDLQRIVAWLDTIGPNAVAHSPSSSFLQQYIQHEFNLIVTVNAGRTEFRFGSNHPDWEPVQLDPLITAIFKEIDRTMYESQRRSPSGSKYLKSVTVGKTIAKILLGRLALLQELNDKEGPPS